MHAMKRILLIGLGRWGTNHLRILKSMPLDLFVADLDPKALGAAEIPEDHCAVDSRSLLAKTDAAVVVTPAHTHFEICRELLQMGEDVFVEKPITLFSHEAKELSILAERSGLILQDGHIFRFDPASLWMRAAIAATHGRNFAGSVPAGVITAFGIACSNRSATCWRCAG